MKSLSDSELKDFLDTKYKQYNCIDFIDTDPIQIPHMFSKNEDIEISAFLSASIAWGKRSIIIRNAKKIVRAMDNAPYDFIMNAQKNDLKVFSGIKHRTFNETDLEYFIISLQNIYKNHGGLKNVFRSPENNSIKEILINFRKVFFELPFPQRTQKHIANIEKKSAAKRINMFLMWMVRNDNSKVHFGIWKHISKSILCMPLDIHSGNTARKLGLLNRKQNDWKAVEELTNNLKKFDKNDPVKYDFALFGLGVFEKFGS